MVESILEAMNSWGWETHDFENESNCISFKDPKWKRPYTGIVRDDLQQSGSFCVFENTLKTNADRIFHYNDNTGWVIWYGVPEMRTFFDSETIHYASNGARYIKLHQSTKPSFVTTRKIK